MSTVIPIERDPHAAVLELLPWYARSQLDDEEMGEVRGHLQSCARCQAELDAERALQGLPLATAEPASTAALEAGLARMRQRIKHAEAPRGAAAPARAAWFPWILGLQGAAIAGLLVLLVLPRLQEEPADYRALAAPGSDAAATAQALVMFRPDTPEAQIRAALQEAGATLAGGPTESGAYALRLPREGRHEALARLRARPGVTLAESLEPGP